MTQPISVEERDTLERVGEQLRNYLEEHGLETSGMSIPEPGIQEELRQEAVIKEEDSDFVAYLVIKHTPEMPVGLRQSLMDDNPSDRDVLVHKSERSFRGSPARTEFEVVL